MADSLRVAKSKRWRHGLKVAETAVPHCMLWLLVGGDAPSPQHAKGPHLRALHDALSAKVVRPFEEEASAEAKRFKHAGGSGTHDVQAARVTVAGRLPTCWCCGL